MTTNATVEARHYEAAQAPGIWLESQIAHAQTLANLEAARAENADLTNRLAGIDPTPWADFHGDLPDYDHPLRPVYESGIQYAVNLLAEVLDVTDYEVCDGTEEFDGDLGGTLGNIVLAAMPKDEHGDPIWPKDLHTPSPCPSCAAKDEAMAEMRATITEAMDLGVTEEAWDVLKPYRIPPADPVAEALKAEALAIVLAESIRRTDRQIEAIRNGQAGQGKVELALSALKRGLELSRLGGAK